MATLKLTTWNIEHSSRLLPTPPPAREPRLRGMRSKPWILMSCDSSRGCQTTPETSQAWVKAPEGLAGRYHVATIPGTEEILAQDPPNPRKALQKLYSMQGNDQTGSQWIWFLVRGGLFQEGATTPDFCYHRFCRAKWGASGALILS